MILDFIEKTGAYIVRVPRKDSALIQELVRQHGLDFSTSASTAQEAVLFTREPYAAAAFWQHATPRAQQALGQIHTEIEASWAPESKFYPRVPADKELWPFQRAGVEFALRRCNTLIGDQPGLGKTCQAIAFCNEVQAKRILVICPANIRRQWERQIIDWSTAPWPNMIYRIDRASQGVHPSSTWTVVSYDLARVESLWKALAKGKYDVLVIDEAHYCKTVDARRTRTIFGGGQHAVANALASRSERILALTGTPLPNRPREAYVLARNLNFDCIDWQSEDHFKARFNPSRVIELPDGRRAIDERSGRHAELQARLRANIMVRRLKRDVMPQLKLPVFDLIQVEETSTVKQALRAESLLDIDPENLEGADMSVMGQIAAVRKMMGVAMAPQIADYIDMLLDGGEEKIVLFYWHIAVGDILEKKLRKHGVARIDGSTSSAKRERERTRFARDPKCQVILGNLQAMGVGVDGLQEVAWHVLLAEPDWVPGANQQAIDRLDRGGQKGQVQADLFVAPGSLAEKILASALRKMGTIHKSLDDHM